MEIADGSRPNVDLTELHKSPFAILRATTRDDRRRIVELAEERSLELDPDLCQKARAELTNVRQRLSAEVQWLPGVSPRRAFELLDLLSRAPMAIRDEAGLPTLAHLNLLAAALGTAERHDPDDLAEWLQKMALLAERLSSEEVLRDINEDRAVSGFPEVRARELIEEELAGRKRYYRKVLRDALDKLSTTELIQVMTDTLEVATEGGEVQAPRLLDDLVDAYEVEAHDVLEKESENARVLIDVARRAAASGEAAVASHIDRLAQVVRNWDMIAQPIQLSSKARGIEHQPSRRLAFEVRRLAIDLVNEHGMTRQAQRLIELLRELFSEIPDVAERVDEDVDELAQLLRSQEEANSLAGEWARSIEYRADLGIIFKRELRISAEGVSWKGRNFPLDTVTRIRWGGVVRYVNGVKMGTIYTIAFGDQTSEAIVELKDENVYRNFVGRLWKAVGLRLLLQMLAALKDGNDLRFGSAILHDDGITLVKHRLLRPYQKVRCPWHQVRTWSQDGSFYVGAKEDRKVYVRFSYREDFNIHVLEHAISLAVKHPGVRRLSELLR